MHIPEQPQSAEFNLENVPEIFRPFAIALAGKPNAGEELIRLLGTLGEKASKSDAARFALQLRSCLPDSARLRRVTSVFLSRVYPPWYVQAVNDAHRNDCYRLALLESVRPGAIVIEVGAGSGLFSMMAARAGARHVFSFEAAPAVAEIARENIARNGLQERITVIDAFAESAEAADLVEKGDVLIHELVSSEFINPGMHELMSSFRANLLKADAVVLPRLVGSKGIVVGDDWIANLVQVPQSVEGFEVSALNRLKLGSYPLMGPVTLRKPLSDEFILAEADLCGEDSANKPVQRLEIPILEDGVARGVLQWVYQVLTPSVVYENRPERHCHWKLNFWPFHEPVAVRRGVPLVLDVAVTDTELLIDAPSEPITRA